MRGAACQEEAEEGRGSRATARLIKACDTHGSIRRGGVEWQRFGMPVQTMSTGGTSLHGMATMGRHKSTRSLAG
jgi:hypothetical protein